MYKFIYRIIIVCCLFYGSYAQTNTTEEPTTSVSPSTITSTSTPKPPKNISCETHNGDCKACVAESGCYFCDENSQCHSHVKNVIADGQCDMNKAHFLTCKISFKTLMIIAAVFIGLGLLIILIVCCYCCCKKKGIKISKDDLKWARQKEERKQIAAERRKERSERTEEIRKKYGLVKESNPYQKFDDA